MALLTELDRDECVELLRTSVLGRVALTTPDGPHIVPVNYTVGDEGVLLATSPYSVLGSQGRGSVLAFEVDAFDPRTRQGWSVVLRGRAEVVDPLVRDGIGPDGVPLPWADGARALLLRIPWTDLSGRRLGRGLSG